MRCAACVEREQIKMATDTRGDKTTPTLAELCEAIAEGRVRYALQDGQYRVNGADARRLRAQARLLDLLDGGLDVSAAQGVDMGAMA